MPGCVCANAAEPASRPQSSAAQASIRLEEKAFNVSGMSGQQGIRESYQARPPPITASGGSVTSFPRR
ncbi:MAG TPA: hypothetical protein VNY08_07685 [Bradyrhizobium sp.]|nr:hypothetical protein [Bradyrhizobium sp.]